MQDPDGDGVYEFSTDEIPAGDHEFKFGVQFTKGDAKTLIQPGFGGVRIGCGHHCLRLPRFTAGDLASDDWTGR